MRVRWFFLLPALSLALTILPAQSTEKQTEQAEAQSDVETVEVSHPGRVRLTGFSFLGAYSHFPGRSFYYPYGYYDPFWYPSFWGPYPWFGPGRYDTFATAAGPSGQVRLETNVEEAEVHIDGAYAGPASNLKRFSLDTGVHGLKITAAGYIPFEAKIYVITGKKLRIRATLKPEGEVP